MKKLKFLFSVFFAILFATSSKAQQVELDGPRVGITFLAGQVADDLEEAFSAKPIITQFGWQFETDFFTLESGTTGLVEMIILIGGVEQGKFLPSISGLMGFRGKTGFEIGFGPNLSLSGLRLAFGIGITVKLEDKVNIPINLAIVPGDGVRISLLTGFNASK